MVGWFVMLDGALDSVNDFANPAFVLTTGEIICGFKVDV